MGPLNPTAHKLVVIPPVQFEYFESQLTISLLSRPYLQYPAEILTYVPPLH